MHQNIRWKNGLWEFRIHFLVEEMRQMVLWEWLPRESGTEKKQGLLSRKIQECCELFSVSIWKKVYYKFIWNNINTSCLMWVCYSFNVMFCIMIYCSRYKYSRKNETMQNLLKPKVFPPFKNVFMQWKDGNCIKRIIQISMHQRCTFWENWNIIIEVEHFILLNIVFIANGTEWFGWFISN